MDEDTENDQGEDHEDVQEDPVDEQDGIEDDEEEEEDTLKGINRRGTDTSNRPAAPEYVGSRLPMCQQAQPGLPSPQKSQRRTTQIAAANTGVRSFAEMKAAMLAAQTAA